MAEQPGRSDEYRIDPRLLATGVGCEPDLQELAAQAKALRKTMSSTKADKSIRTKASTQSNMSPELLAKVDSILAIVQNLQASQREIYNYVRAMAPKYSVIPTEGPVEHFETINQAHTDAEAAYLVKLRQWLRKTKD